MFVVSFWRIMKCTISFTLLCAVFFLVRKIVPDHCNTTLKTAFEEISFCLGSSREVSRLLRL